MIQIQSFALRFGTIPLIAFTVEAAISYAPPVMLIAFVMRILESFSPVFFNGSI